MYLCFVFYGMFINSMCWLVKVVRKKKRNKTKESLEKEVYENRVVKPKAYVVYLKILL